MSAPVSNGVLRTKLSDMKIGDYIKWGYTAFSANVAGTLQEDTTGMAELSSTTAASSGGGGYFYFIKWKQGLLIADRAIQSSISAQSLNKVGYYKGSKYRLLTEEEFKAAMSDDFGGNFKFSTNPQTTMALGDIYQWSINQDVFYRLIFQNSAQKISCSKYDGSYDANVLGYIGNKLEYNVADGHVYSNWGPYHSTFLPCMEYVDNSKSTNIFY